MSRMEIQMMPGKRLIEFSVSSLDRQAPPLGMASRAFTARFIKTCSNLRRIDFTDTRSGFGRVYPGVVIVARLLAGWS